MYSKVSVFQIIKLLQLHKIGRKTALKILINSDFQIGTDKDLKDAVRSQTNILNLGYYSDNDFENAFIKADQIFKKSEKNNINFITYWDVEYPELLKKIQDYPIVLNYKGNVNHLSKLSTVAIIGTRNASDFGFRYGKNLAKKCAENKFNIVSGLALGCDSAGHLGAIEANGVTTAVLAHGLDYIYPADNKNLAANILDNDGVLISEYFIGTRGLPNYFVERDRIQAGLSLGTIVIETDIKGGSMHTVNNTLENGRKVACIDFPSDPTKKLNNEGNKMLIRQGKAIPIYNEEELLIFLNEIKCSAIKNINVETSDDIKDLFYPSKEVKNDYVNPTLKKTNLDLSNTQENSSNPMKNVSDGTKIVVTLTSEYENLTKDINEIELNLKLKKKRKKELEKQLGISMIKGKKSSQDTDSTLFKL